MQSSIDHALHAMRTELIRLGMEPEEDLICGSSDSHHARVSKLTLTMHHLSDLHKSRNDALMFISHDIRTPLSAAMMLVDKFEKANKVKKPAAKKGLEKFIGDEEDDEV